jgi:hypothetical protein
MEKITFGDNIPGYIYGPEDAPGVVMLQASFDATSYMLPRYCEQQYCNPVVSLIKPVDMCDVGVVGIHNW